MSRPGLNVKEEAVDKVTAERKGGVAGGQTAEEWRDGERVKLEGVTPEQVSGGMESVEPEQLSSLFELIRAGQEEMKFRMREQKDETRQLRYDMKMMHDRMDASKEDMRQFKNEMVEKLDQMVCKTDLEEIKHEIMDFKDEMRGIVTNLRNEMITRSDLDEVLEDFRELRDTIVGNADGKLNIEEIIEEREVTDSEGSVTENTAKEMVASEVTELEVIEESEVMGIEDSEVTVIEVSEVLGEIKVDFAREKKILEIELAGKEENMNRFVEFVGFTNSMNGLVQECAGEEYRYEVDNRYYPVKRRMETGVVILGRKVKFKMFAGLGLGIIYFVNRIVIFLIMASIYRSAIVS